MTHTPKPTRKTYTPFSSVRSDRINEEIEELKAQDLEDQIREESPDGRPAYPLERGKEILMLIAGSLVAVLAISGATYALWGFDEALMVLGLGMVLAVAGNPVIWAMFFRSKEREEINHDREGRVSLRSSHKPHTR